MRFWALVCLAVAAVVSACVPTQEAAPIVESQRPADQIGDLDGQSIEDHVVVGRCAEAWETAAQVSTLQDAHEDYRETLAACETYEEWHEQNTAHGSRYAPGPHVVFNLCQTLSVQEPICDDARDTADRERRDRDHRVLQEREEQRREAQVLADEAGLEPMTEDVRLDIHAWADEGWVMVTAESNLPNGTRVMIDVDGAQQRIELQDGTFEPQRFGPQSATGTARVQVLVPVARVQPDLVQIVIGEEGEHLTGPLVEEGDMGRIVVREILIDRSW